MPFAGFSEAAIAFLTELSKNNERDWFEAHREDSERLLIDPAKAFVEALGPRLRELDPKIQAIPRVLGSIKALEQRRRFPNSRRPPYKDHLDLWFWTGRRGIWENSGFFLRLSPARLVLAAGMIELQTETLARYRQQVLDDERGSALATIVAELRASGYVVGGERYKRMPGGLPKEHPRASLLRHRGLFVTASSEHPEELHTSAFVDFAFGHFARMSPLHHWLRAMWA